DGGSNRSFVSAQQDPFPRCLLPAARLPRAISPSNGHRALCSPAPMPACPLAPHVTRSDGHSRRSMLCNGVPFSSTRGGPGWGGTNTIRGKARADRSEFVWLMTSLLETWQKQSPVIVQEKCPKY